MSDGLSSSPAGDHAAELTYAGEIPFGPSYFSLRIDARSFGDRMFGDGVLWSPDGSIVAVTEWHTTDRAAGPITSLLLIRPRDWTWFRFPVVAKGFATAAGFVGDSLVLRHTDRRFAAGTSVVEHETDLAAIADWRPLAADCADEDR